MHEPSVTEAMLKMVLGKAAESNAAKVARIALVVGDSTGYVGDSIQFYFDRYSKGTIAEGALIEVERVEAKMRCRSCGELFVRKPFSFTCPLCGGDGVATSIGNEFYIDSIDIEQKKGNTDEQ